MRVGERRGDTERVNREHGEDRLHERLFHTFHARFQARKDAGIDQPL